MAEVAKNNVLHMVAKLSELQLLEVCDAEGLKLSKTKKDRKTAMRNMLTRHISSEEVEESPDEGLALFEKLSAQMRDMLSEDTEELERLQKEQEMKLAMDVDSKLKVLKSTLDEFELDGGSGQSAIGGNFNPGLARLAEQKSSEIAFESIIDKIVTEKLKASMLNMSMDSGSGGGHSGRPTDSSREENVSMRNELTEGVPKVSTTTTTTELHKVKLRDFKITNGNIGVKGSLDYSDLIMQMKKGLASGYSEKEVMSGVIDAAKPGSELRKYLVRKENQAPMTYEDFKQTLREFHNVRESQSIMDEMREMVQGEDQDLLKYVMSMCALRDEVFEVSASEDCPPGEALVKKRFVDSLLSGLRKPTVRLEMQAVLKQELSDPKLFNEVNQIDKRVKENEKKVGSETHAVEVKSVDVSKKNLSRSQRQDDAWRDETAAKLESLVLQVSKLEAMLNKVTGVNASAKSSDGSLEAKMATLLGQVQHLTAQMEEYQAGVAIKNPGASSASSGKKVSFGKFKFRCDDCKPDSKFCRHCLKCKKEGHKIADCPENS